VRRGDLEIRKSVVIPAGELVETASRAGGPGGQHVNKTSTRVTLRWNVRDSAALTAAQRARLLERLEPRLTRAGSVVVHAARFRSRARNREAARERLAEFVREALRPTRRRVPTRPGKAARERRLHEKKRRSATKQQRARPRGDDG
jgi:ribosome-associated protein